jgi:hypothetical protein
LLVTESHSTQNLTKPFHTGLLRIVGELVGVSKDTIEFSEEMVRAD